MQSFRLIYRIPEKYAQIKQKMVWRKFRPTAWLDYIPQVLPVLQEDAELRLEEREPPPMILAAKVEIFRCTSELLHTGQLTSLTALALRSSSSNS